MIVHGQYPNELLKSTILSLPNDKKTSLSNNDNYRVISMLNSIHKLFHYVIIDICGDSLSTSDCKLHGYKNNHSTNMCTVILKEVTHHYINGNSNVYSSLLDASKAFNKINWTSYFPHYCNVT